MKRYAGAMYRIDVYKYERSRAPLWCAIVASVALLGTGGCEAILDIEELEYRPVDGMVEQPVVGMVDRGLLVRYHIDEADRDSLPPQIRDATEDPFNLDIEPSASMTLGEFGGHYGLRWDAARRDGGTVGYIDEGIKVREGLIGKTALTVEMVVSMRGTNNMDTFLFRLGDPTDQVEIFSLESDEPDFVDLVWPSDVTVARWPLQFGDVRRVLHLVIDTGLPEESRRARLYENGIPIPLAAGASYLAENHRIAQQDGRTLSLGNRPGAGHSIEGAIFYAAVYTAPLTPEEVAHNAARLLLDDDTPAESVIIEPE